MVFAPRDGVDQTREFNQDKTPQRAERLRSNGTGNVPEARPGWASMGSPLRADPEPGHSPLTSRTGSNRGGRRNTERKCNLPESPGGDRNLVGSGNPVRRGGSECPPPHGGGARGCPGLTRACPEPDRSPGAPRSSHRCLMGINANYGPGESAPGQGQGQGLAGVGEETTHSTVTHLYPFYPFFPLKCGLEASRPEAGQHRPPTAAAGATPGHGARRRDLTGTTSRRVPPCAPASPPVFPGSHPPPHRPSPPPPLGYRALP